MIYIGDQGTITGTRIAMSEVYGETDPNAQPNIIISKAIFNDFKLLDKRNLLSITPTIATTDSVDNLTIGNNLHDVIINANDFNVIVDSANFKLDAMGNINVWGDISTPEGNLFAKLDDNAISDNKTWSSEAIDNAHEQLTLLTEIASPYGVAILDSDRKVPLNQLFDVAITKVNIANTEAHQLALDVQIGDVCKRTDNKSTYMALSSNNTDMSNWTKLIADGEVVTVSGRIGHIVFDSTDVLLENVLNEKQLSTNDNLGDLISPILARGNLGLNSIADSVISGAALIGIFNDNSDNIQTVLNNTDISISTKSNINHTHPTLIGDTGFGGVEGMVPVAMTTDASKFLAGDATFKEGVRPENNLFELTDKSASRLNIGLGNSAIADVGTRAGTVASGEHAHATAISVFDGYVSAIDKFKLNGIEDNSNNYIHPTDIGNIHLPAGGSVQKFVKWSSNGTGFWANIISSDVSGFGLAAFRNVGITINDVAAGDHGHLGATAATDGFMTAADKAKLNLIPAGSENYQHPTTNGSLHLPMDGGPNEFVRWAAPGTGIWTGLDISDIANAGQAMHMDVGTTTGTVSSGDHDHINVTTTISGYMSGLDKTKLDGIEANANNYVHPTTDGNVHIPTAGATGEFIKWSALGTGSWSGITNNDVSGLGNSVTLDTGTDTGEVALGDHDHVYATAGGASGFVFGPDKTKLDNVETSANNYIHPTTDGNVHIPTAGATGEFVKWSALGTGSWSGITNNDVSGLGNSAILDVGDVNGTVASSTHIHDNATTTVSGFMPNIDKVKIDGIEANANNYVHPITDGNVHIPTAGATGDFVKWSALGTGSWSGITNSDVSGLGNVITLNLGTVAGTVSEGNHGHINVTTLASGYMSDVDKTKLDGIEAGAFTYIHPTTDGNVHIPTAGATGEFIKWSALGTGSWSGITNNVVSGLGNSAALDTGTTTGTISEGNHGHINVTTTISGYMSGLDKTKLDGIEANANNYVHPTTDGNVHIPTAGATGEFIKWSALGTGSWSGITNNDVSGLGNSATLDTGTATGEVATGDHNHPNVIASGASGYMSDVDKVKLDGIEEGAGPYTHPITDGSLHTPTGGVSGNFIKWDSLGTGSWSGITNSDVSGLGNSATLDTGTTVGTVATGDHGHDDATTSIDGYISGADKTKLDNNASNANEYIHPIDTHIPASGVAGEFVKWSAPNTGSWSGITNSDVSGLGNAATQDTGTTTGTIAIGNHIHNDATTSVDGQMSGDDKTKLDGIVDGATNYIHPTIAGNNHIPTAGSTGQILGWASDGVASWITQEPVSDITTPIIAGKTVDLFTDEVYTFSAMGSTSTDLDASLITYTWATTIGSFGSTIGDDNILILTPSDVGLTGTISCYAEDDLANTSETAIIMFTVLDAVAPSSVVLTTPGDFNTYTAESLDVSVDNGGDVNLSYFWEVSIDGGSVWTTTGLSDPFIKSPDMTFTETSDNLVKFRCKVTNKAGFDSAESNLLSVFVLDLDVNSQFIDTSNHPVQGSHYSLDGTGLLIPVSEIHSGSNIGPDGGIAFCTFFSYAANAHLLFDDDITTMVESGNVNNPSHHMGYQFTKPTKITQYGFIQRAGYGSDRYATEFVFEGSMDGITYTELDRPTGLTADDWSDTEFTTIFKVPEGNQDFYTYYRAWVVTKSGSNWSLSQFRLWGTPEYGTIEVVDQSNIRILSGDPFAVGDVIQLNGEVQDIITAVSSATVPQVITFANETLTVPPLNQIPQMTSNSGPNGTADSSATYGNNATLGAYNAFDGINGLEDIITSVGCALASQPVSGFISYEYDDGAHTIVSYKIYPTTHPGGYSTNTAPSDFTLEGWNGSSWDVIDSQSGIIGWVDYTPKRFIIDSPTAYTKYQLVITQTEQGNFHGGWWCTVGEIELEEGGWFGSTGELSTLTSPIGSYEVGSIDQQSGENEFTELSVEVQWSRNLFPVSEDSGNVVIAHGSNYTNPFLNGDKVIVSSETTEIVTTINADPIRENLPGDPTAYPLNLFTSNTETSHMDLVTLASDKVLAVYRDTNMSNWIMSNIGTISGTSIIWETSLVVDTSSTTDCRTVLVNSNTVFTSYSATGMWGMAGTFNGATMSWGSPVQVDTAQSYWHTGCNVVDTNKVGISWNRNASGWKAGTAIATITGNTTVFGSVYNLPDIASPSDSQIFAADTNKLVSFTHGWHPSDGTQPNCYLYMGTLSGDVITWETTPTMAFNYGSTENDVIVVTTDKALMVYRNSTNNNQEARMLTFSGTTPTVGPPVVIGALTLGVTLRLISLNTVVYSCSYLNANMQATIVDCSGSIPVFGIPVIASTVGHTAISVTKAGDDIVLAGHNFTTSGLWSSVLGPSFEYFTTITTTDPLPSNPTSIDLIPISLKADLDDGPIALQDLTEEYSAVSVNTARATATLTGDQGSQANISINLNNTDIAYPNITYIKADLKSDIL